MEKTIFEYEDYIQQRLKEIDGLDERKYTKELLLDGLGKFFGQMEARYEALEERVLKELAMPYERFSTCITIIKKDDFDPVNNFWFPVCDEDIKNTAQYPNRTFYLKADDRACQEFFRQGKVRGILEENGKQLDFRPVKSGRYASAVKKLYHLFAENHIPWQTMHLGHLERFFELRPEGDFPPDADIKIQWGKWEEYVMQGMVPLWNIRRMTVRSREFRIPCIDDVFYEHIFYLPDRNAEEAGYLVETNTDILSIRYEKNRVVLKTKKDSLGDVCIYRINPGSPEGSHRYQYPVLSNRRKNTLAARYLQQTGNFLQTPMELRRKVREMAGEYGIETDRFEITDDSADEGGIYGDMNQVTGEGVFSGDKRKVLRILFHTNRKESDDYLLGAQIRYILSCLQMEFMEYRCEGIMI